MNTETNEQKQQRYDKETLTEYFHLCHKSWDFYSLKHFRECFRQYYENNSCLKYFHKAVKETTGMTDLIERIDKVKDIIANYTTKERNFDLKEYFINLDYFYN